MRAADIRPLITELDMDVLPRDPDMWGADLSKKAKIRAATNVYPDGLPPAMQEKLARRYADVFALFLKHDVGRVTFWGVTDATSWLHDFPSPGGSTTLSSGTARGARSRRSRRWPRR